MSLAPIGVVYLLIKFKIKVPGLMTEPPPVEMYNLCPKGTNDQSIASPSGGGGAGGGGGRYVLEAF